MSYGMDNRGVANFGGTTNVTGSAIGDNATVQAGPSDRQLAKTKDSWHFGIVTILPTETRAVLDTLGLADDGAAGQRYYTGRVQVPHGFANVVATQPSGQGQRPIMAALTNLRDRYDPAVLVLVGIGGAIHDDVGINDVVISTRVVFYENRKLLPGKTLRRGQEFQASSAITHSVNAFFTVSGDPATLGGHGGTAPFRVFHGPIGSGEAVLANSNSEIRRYLTRYNDKTMAVEMEAGGLAQFSHDTTTRAGAPLGWVVIRGISDHADVAKNDQFHNSAAVNAALTLRYLIPYIRPQL